jgi:hypothetical protein
MTHDRSSIVTPVTRRHLLRTGLGGAAGLAAWYQGWAYCRSAAAQPKAPSGQMTWALHTTVVPSWFHTWPRPPLHQWGIAPTRLNLSSGRHLRRAMLPKFSTYKTRIWAIML